MKTLTLFLLLNTLVLTGAVIRSESAPDAAGQLVVQATGEYFSQPFTADRLRRLIVQAVPGAVISTLRLPDEASWSVTFSVPGWWRPSRTFALADFPRLAALGDAEPILEESAAFTLPPGWEPETLPDYRPVVAAAGSFDREVRWEAPVLTERTEYRRDTSKPDADLDWQGRIAAEARQRVVLKQYAAANAAVPPVVTRLRCEADGSFALTVADQPVETALPFAALSWEPQSRRDRLVVEVPRGTVLHLSTQPAGIRRTLRSGPDQFDLLEWEADGWTGAPGQPALAVSTTTYAAYAQRLAAALQPCVEEQAETARRARELAGTIAAERDQVRFLRDYLDEKFDLIPPDAPLRTDSFVPVDTLWQKGAIRTIDRTLLLYAMLESLDLHVELLAVGPRLATAVPTAWWEAAQPLCNDLLIRVVGDGGDEEYYVGDAGRFAPLGFTAYDDCIALDLRDGVLLPIQMAPELRTRRESHYTLELDHTGGAQLHVRERFWGAEYERRLRALSTLTSEELQRDFRATVAALAPDAGILQPVARAFGGYPGEESFALELPDWVMRSGPFFYAGLPGWNFDLPALPAAAGPQRWWLWPERLSRQIHYEVVLPPGSRREWTAWPEPLIWNMPCEGGGAAVSVDCDATGERLKLFGALEMTPALISPTDHAAMAAGYAALRAVEREPVIFRASGKE